MTRRKKAAPGRQARRAATNNIHALCYRRGRSPSSAGTDFLDALATAFVRVLRDASDGLRADVLRHRVPAELARRENEVPVVALKDRDQEGWLLVCHPCDIHLLSSLAANYNNLPDPQDFAQF
jgi:hypothetical protein